MAAEAQQLQLYRYSFKIETRAKGLLAVSIHVNSFDADIGRRETVDQLMKLEGDLRAKGKRMVGDVEEVTNSE